MLYTNCVLRENQPKIRLKDHDVYKKKWKYKIMKEKEKQTNKLKLSFYLYSFINAAHSPVIRQMQLRQWHKSNSLTYPCILNLPVTSQVRGTTIQIWWSLQDLQVSKQLIQDPSATYKSNNLSIHVILKIKQYLYTTTFLYFLFCFVFLFFLSLFPFFITYTFISLTHFPGFLTYFTFITSCGRKAEVNYRRYKSMKKLPAFFFLSFLCALVNKMCGQN